MGKASRGQFFASREFGYDDKYPVLDREQVITLGGHPNDQKLVGLRYLLPVDPGEELHTCAECGAEFITLGARERHGELRHGYTCECGWQPGQGVRHKGAALTNHRHHCEAYKAKVAEERARHVAEVAEIPNRGPG